MSLETLCSVALHKGAGVSLKEVKASSSYRRKLTHYRTLLDRYPEQTDLGVALRSGIYNFAGDLYAMGEKGAQKEARKRSLGTPHNVVVHAEDLALIHEVGDRIIWRAARMIPPDVAARAKHWQRLSTDQQFNILLLLFEEDIYKHNGMKSTDAQRVEQQAQINRAYDECFPLPLDPSFDEERLPNGYNWFESTRVDYKLSYFLPHLMTSQARPDRPNCLGFAILMCGFAYLTGGRYHFCTTIEHVAETTDAVSVVGYTGLLEALREIGFSEEDDPTLFKQLHDRAFAARAHLGAVLDWHHSLMMEFGDGLLHVDPYMDRWRKVHNVNPKERSTTAGAASDAVCKYSSVLPGITTVATDYGDIKRWGAFFINKLDEAVEHMRQFRKEADALTSFDIQSMVDGCPSIVALSYQIKGLHGLKRRHLPRITLWNNLFRLDGDEVDERGKPRSKAAIKRLEQERYQRFLEDPMYREERLRWFASRYIVAAYHMFSREVRDVTVPGPYQHFEPALELTNPAFGIAMAVLSNLRSWTNDDTSGTILLNYSNSQMLWHEAVCPVPDPAKLSIRDRRILKYWNWHLKHTKPLHKRVKMKVEITSTLPGMEVPDDRNTDTTGDDTGGNSGASDEVPG